MRKMLLILAAVVAMSCVPSGAQVRDDVIGREAAKAVSEGRWEDAAAMLQGLESSGSLSSRQYMGLAMALLRTDNARGALAACSRWQERYPDPGWTDLSVRLEVVKLSAFAYGEYGVSLSTAARLAPFLKGTEATANLRHMALCSGALGDDAGAADMYRLYAEARMDELGMTPDEIIDRGVDEPDLAKAFLCLAQHEIGGNIETAVEYMVLAAACGSREAAQMVTELEGML